MPRLLNHDGGLRRWIASFADANIEWSIFIWFLACYSWRRLPGRTKSMTWQLFRKSQAIRRSTKKLNYVSPIKLPCEIVHTNFESVIYKCFPILTNLSTIKLTKLTVSISYTLNQRVLHRTPENPMQPTYPQKIKSSNSNWHKRFPTLTNLPTMKFYNLIYSSSTRSTENSTKSQGTYIPQKAKSSNSNQHRFPMSPT